MSSAHQAYDCARRFLKEEVAPRAQEMDGSPSALRSALAGLCELDLMALCRPVEFGGPDMPEPLFAAYQREMARTSGALAFLTTQHQSAVSMLRGAENRALAEEYLPQMGDGRKLVGIGFSQLRRPGPPMLRAEPVAGGYRLDGEAPWVTGADYYHEFLAGSALPDGRAVFGLVPLATLPDGSVELTAPMRLAAMGSANTVSVTLRSFFLPSERTAFIRPAGWIQTNDMINVTLQSHFAIGCAQAGIDIVRDAATKKNLPALGEAADLLEAEVAACRDGAATTSGFEGSSTESGIDGRAWSIDLAVRCAHAAIAASSGAANLVTHPAQRVYREALVYTVSAQSVQIMEATLLRLTRSGFRVPE